MTIRPTSLFFPFFLKSEQELVDCADNGGCNGGGFSKAFSYISDSGVASFVDYPFLAAQGSCEVTPTPNPSTR